ncbi:penicillin-binding protein 2 [Candidatus Pelagibacter bacterium]|jgi:cell division protein FtsI (penicillin-binding protein 3)|nr:penicillin-binding protein 2 [Candidatus Pelagibacter bacterium]|tara:strand:+ start:595 stop:2274 length:1680 start_codon:yes stop_codon:yes gene_type:complete
MNKDIKENIILEEFDNEFSFKKNKSNLKIEFNRIAFLFFIFFVISIIYSIQLLHLGSLKSNIVNTKTPISEKNHRADIIDRNGNYLVKSVRSIDIGINPVEVIDKKKLLINLKLIFPNKDYSKIKKKLNKKQFFKFEKQLSQENYQKIMSLGDKSIRPEENLTRLYPQKKLFSHIIGQIDDGNNGISGLEKSFDQELKDSVEPLQLTVDTEIQFLIREELIKYHSIFQSKGSAAILMDSTNGEILSLVSYPDFDLNKREKITDINYINRATKGIYELGSVFKAFTIAAGFNEGLIEPETQFLNLKKELSCAGFPIREYDKNLPTDLTVEEILIKSGNIGSVKIGQKIGIDKFKNFLYDTGVLGKINFDIEEVGQPQPVTWGKCKLATASFGHGINTNLLQLTKGYAIISNGGYDVKPTLIKKETDVYKKTIITKATSQKINSILRKIVVTGTAKLANVDGYEIGGKTGTANKTINGVYTNKKINTFASVFPISKPQFVFVVLIDEPQINNSYIYEYRDGSGFKLKGAPRNTAGWTSVEVAGKIIEKIGPILATKYIEIN